MQSPAFQILSHPDNVSNQFQVQRQPFHVLLSYSLAIIWILLVAALMISVNRWSTRPGEKGDLVLSWPTESKLIRHAGEQQLVMFVHPKCPCSKASAYELERLLSGFGGQVFVDVVFICPFGTSDEFATGDVVESFQQICGVRFSTDLGGVEAERFGVRTSGHVFQFDAHGLLLFEGGITIARGHRGENIATQSIRNIASGKTSTFQSWPVLGCGVQ